MRKWLAAIIVCLFFVAGCAATKLNKNPLRNLTDKQSDLFERTSDGWRFED